MALEGQREEGAEPQSPGRVARSFPALTVPPRGSSVILAPRHWELSSLRGHTAPTSHLCFPTAYAAPQCIQA